MCLNETYSKIRIGKLLSDKFPIQNGLEQDVDLREIGIDGANWIRLAQDRIQWRAFVNTVMNLRVP
jgi:hypothetical protein